MALVTVRNATVPLFGRPHRRRLNTVDVAKTLWETDYPQMLMPDHMPQHRNDPRERRAFAYGFGYIRGILQTLQAN